MLDMPMRFGEVEPRVNMTDFLYATPGFLTGFARVADLAAVLEQCSYNISQTPEQADNWAFANGWAAVGGDLKKAIAKQQQANQTSK